MTSEQPGVFVKSRLRAYGGKLNSSLDATMALANSVSLAPGVLYAPLAALASKAGEAALDGVLEPGALRTAKQPPAVSSVGPTAGLESDVQLLKSEIAGMQCVLAYLKGADDISNLGKKLCRHPTQEQLRRRAESVTRSINDQPLRQAGVLPALPQTSSSPGATSPSIQSPIRKPAAAPSHNPLQGSKPVLLSGSRPLSSTSPGMSEGGAGRVDVASPAPSDVSQRGFDVLSQDIRGNATTWRRPRPVAPVGRGEAVILEAALDEALPSGAITAKYTGAALHAHAVAENIRSAIGRGDFAGGGMDGSVPEGAAPGPYQPPSPAQVLLDSQDIRSDKELLDSVMSEAARQVASTCAERGRLILKLCDRYQEVFSSMSAMVGALHVSNNTLVEHLTAERETVVHQSSRISELLADLKLKQGTIDQQDFQIKSLTAELEHAHWDMQQEVAKLMEQNEILAQQADDIRESLEGEIDDREEALNRGRAALEGQLSTITDERDDLIQRIRFLEKQLVAFRHGASRVTPMANSCIQTDPVDFYEEQQESEVAEDSELGGLAGLGENQPDVSLLAPAVDSGSSATMLAAKNLRRKKRPLRSLGGFDGLITTDRPGRIRGLQWTQAAISSMYTDKVVADTIADRDVRPRSKICEFALEWHLNKYGLRNLAEVNLVDLIASVRHHAKTVPRVKWFAQFIGLMELGREVLNDTTQHVSFYLFLIQQLAFPNSLACLFPDHEDMAPPRMSTTTLPEVTKAVFRYLYDPDQASAFMTQQVEPLIENDHLDAQPGTVLLEPLIRLFMVEYQHRSTRANTHLKALFQAGDADRDGLIGYEAFMTLIELSAVDLNERLKAAMYSEAIRSLPPGQHLIPCYVWMAVARTFGFDRWKVETTSLTAQLNSMAMPSGGQLLAQGPGVLPLLGGPATLSQPVYPALVTASSMRRLDSARNVDRGIWTALRAALQDMTPPLPELFDRACSALAPSSSALPPLKQQAAHFAYILNNLPQAKGLPFVGFIADALTTMDDQNGDGVGHGTGSMYQARPESSSPTRSSGVVLTQTKPRRSSRVEGSSGDFRRTSNTRARSASSSGPVATAAIGESHQIAMVYLTGAAATATMAALSTPPTPPDAAEAWCAFTMLFNMIQAALSPARPPSRTLARPGDAKLRANSPGAGRTVIQPANAWRSGYPTASSANPGMPDKKRLVKLQTEMDATNREPANASARNNAAELAQMAIDGATSMTEMMMALKSYRVTMETMELPNGKAEEVISQTGPPPPLGVELSHAWQAMAANGVGQTLPGSDEHFPRNPYPVDPSPFLANQSSTEFLGFPNMQVS